MLTFFSQFLSSFWPCLSSPCNYGGTCTNGPGEGEFSCQCKPEVSVRPFIDDACNIGRLLSVKAYLIYQYLYSAIENTANQKGSNPIHILRYATPRVVFHETNPGDTCGLHIFTPKRERIETGEFDICFLTTKKFPEEGL